MFDSKLILEGATPVETVNNLSQKNLNLCIIENNSKIEDSTTGQNKSALNHPNMIPVVKLSNPVLKQNTKNKKIKIKEMKIKELLNYKKQIQTPEF